jgi:curved DNA-binding protein
MSDSRPFMDYYNILQVDPACDAKALETAYHDLLKLYHPDHAGTADTKKFNEVIEAFRVLRNPTKRAEYDLLHAKNNPEVWSGSRSSDEANVDVQDALDDAEDHARILMFLYQKRRENAQSAGVVGYYIQQMLNCSDEHFEFHKWYLKEKGFIVITEQGTLAITIEGIDHVISTSRTTKAETLLISKFRQAEES